MGDMHKTFSEYVRTLVIEAQNGYCFIPGCHELINDMHHCVPNTEYNQKRFPLFLQSPFNCRGLCREHHDRYTEYECLEITFRQAEIYEEWLTKLQAKTLR